MGKIIFFLRITIRQIELEILEQTKKNSIEIKKIKNELRNKPNLNFNRMKAELEEAKKLFAKNDPAKANAVNSNNNVLNALIKLMKNRNKLTENAGPGPAKESAVNSNNERIAELMRIMKERHNQNGGPANSNNEALRRAMLEQQNPNGTSANQTKHFSNNPNESFKSPLLEITHQGRRNLQPKQELHNLNNSGLASSENLEQFVKSPLLEITHRGLRNQPSSQPQMSNLEARLAALRND